MTQDLKTLISAAAVAALTPEKIEAQIESKVEGLIKESVNSALSRYSETGQVIEKAVAEALKVSDLDIPSYGETVQKMLKVQIEALVAPILSERLQSDMAELLSLAPKTAKLSDLVNDLKSDKDEMDRATYEQIVTCIIEPSDYGGGYWIHLDEDVYEDSEKYSCDIQIGLSENGTIFSASFRGRKLDDTRYLGKSYGIEQKIRSYFAVGTILEIDENNIDVCGDLD